MVDPYNQAARSQNTMGGERGKRECEFYYNMRLTSGLHCPRLKPLLAVANGAISLGEEAALARGRVPQQLAWRQWMVSYAEQRTLEHNKLAGDAKGLHDGVRTNGIAAKHKVMQAHGVHPPRQGAHASPSLKRTLEPHTPPSVDRGRSKSEVAHRLLNVVHTMATALSGRPIAPHTCKNILLSLRKLMATAMKCNADLDAATTSSDQGGDKKAGVVPGLVEHGPLRFILKEANGLDVFRHSGVLQAISQLVVDMEACMDKGVAWPNAGTSLAKVEEHHLKVWGDEDLSYEHPQGSTGTRGSLEQHDWSRYLGGGNDKMRFQGLVPEAAWVRLASLPIVHALAQEVLLTYILEGFCEEAPTPSDNLLWKVMASVKTLQQPTPSNEVKLFTSQQLSYAIRMMAIKSKYAKKPMPMPTPVKAGRHSTSAKRRRTGGAADDGEESDEVIYLCSEELPQDTHVRASLLHMFE